VDPHAPNERSTRRDIAIILRRSQLISLTPLVDFMRSVRQTMTKGTATIVTASALVLLAAGCGNPRSEAATAQALNDAANEIGGLKNDMSDLQAQVDSLRSTVARQDTLIARIAEVNHIPIK
jgi:septal ring factor EnvC (AmiA/AmiB activator)